MKSMIDAVFPQPESALDSPFSKAEIARDMEALLEAIHMKDSALLEKENVILEKDDIIQKKSQVIEEQKKRITLLEEYLRLERARLYGRSSEKSGNQGEIFNEAELVDCATQLDEDEPEQPEPDSNSRKPLKGRQPFSPSLPRVQERAELSEEEKAGAIDTFFVKVRKSWTSFQQKFRSGKSCRKKPSIQKKTSMVKKNG